MIALSELIHEGMRPRRVGVRADDLAAGIDAEHLRGLRADDFEIPIIATFRSEEAARVLLRNAGIETGEAAAEKPRRSKQATRRRDSSFR